MHISATHAFTFLSLPSETTHNNILHLPTIYHSLHLFSQFLNLCSPLAVHQVTITVKIQDIRENTTRWLQHECREIQMSTYSVADSTASILLTTWNNMDLTINNWYTLSPVTVKDYNNTITLSTSPSTTAETMARPRRHSVAAPVPDNSEEVTGHIIGAMTTSTITCPKRHPLPNCPPGAPFHLCPTCNQHFITAKLRHQWHVALTLEINDTTTKEFQMDHTVILNTAPKHICLDTDPITITGHFLSIGLVTMRVKDDVISALHPYTPSTSVQQHTDITDETLLTYLDETLSTNTV